VYGSITPTLLKTVSGVNVSALAAGGETWISVSYDEFISDFGADPINGIWRDSIDRNIHFSFSCEVDPSDNIDESVEDNNKVSWPDDNIVSYNPNPDWEFDPEDEDDDVTQDPFTTLDELWFFPNMAGFPDRRNQILGTSSSSNYVVVADINQDGQQQGLILLNDRPYLIDDSGIDESTTFAGISGVPIRNIAVGDVAGDSDLEIVGISRMKLYVWNGDGSLVTGWPEELAENYGAFRKFLIISDFDGASKAEIAVACTISENDDYPDGADEVRIYDGSGSYDNKILAEKEVEWIVSGDISNSSSSNELIAIIKDTTSATPPTSNDTYLYAWDSDFDSVLAADSYIVAPDVFGNLVPLICDYDDDGTTEILITEDLSGTLKGQAYNTSSADAETGIDAFKAELDSNQTAPWIAAELVSGNDTPEFLTTILDNEKLGQMYLSAGDIEYTPYYPHIGYTASDVYSPILADLDDDGNVDIALPCRNGYIYFREAELGTEELEHLFPTDLRLYIPEEINSTIEYVRHLAIADLDNDDDYEIIAVSNLGHVFVWETDCDDASSIQWEQYLHDAGHRNYADEY